MTAAMMRKRQEQLRLAELYEAERSRHYQGDEDFMNTLHPFEETGKDAGKKSSPIQKALIRCIKDNGGSASEEQLLDYITKKWDIIMKYSERCFAEEPSVRIIRLNCAVKKRARHLFLPDPNKEGNWILNAAPRKIPIRRTAITANYISSDSDGHEAPNDDKDSRPNGENGNEHFDNGEQNTVVEDDDDDNIITRLNIMKKNTFDYMVEMFVRERNDPFTLTEISNSMKEYENMPGIFSCLPLERRTKADLICLKSTGLLTFDSETGLWAPTKKNVRSSDVFPYNLPSIRKKYNLPPLQT